MKQNTQEWVNKAEGDFHTAQREVRARKHPNYDAACFHAQQCAEKYLKARLIEAGISFPKTHDLNLLLNLVLPIEPLWESYRWSLNLLLDYAVGYRYPGDSADKETAREALKICKSIRKAVRASLEKTS
jgi:HEPN domain-containing protein